MVYDKNPTYINKLFDEIASYYDKTNNFISFYTHYFIKINAVKLLEIKPRTMVLDVCCGTGDLTQIIRKFFPRAKIIGLDFSKNMLLQAKKKNPEEVFIQADCTKLPFKDNEFDYVTAAFGLRNIQDRKKAIREIYRVLNYGGKFMHLDFGEKNKFSKIFDYIVPFISKILKLNLQHYNYLISSKNEFPSSNELIKEFENCNFKYIKKADYLFNTISVQIMQK